jgi:hypothetical protein
MEQLPKHFAIATPEDYETNPLWAKYIKWLNGYAYENNPRTGTWCWDGNTEGAYYGIGKNICWGNTEWNHELSSFPKGTVKLTLEQWDEIVNPKHEKMQKQKEPIGYKLKKEFECYRKVALAIVPDSNYLMNSVGRINTDSSTANQLEKAGVLKLWFEPIYKHQETTVQMNEVFDLKITNEGIFHKSDNITEYVEQMYKWYLSIPAQFDSYAFEIKEVVLSKTGCQSNETTVEKWIEVWNEYLRINK